MTGYDDRSSHQRCSVGKSVLENFAKFTGKHLCQSLFFNKVAGLTEHLSVTASVTTLLSHFKICHFHRVRENGEKSCSIMLGNSFLKFIEFGIHLKWSAAHYYQKQKHFLLPHHQLPKNMVLVFGSYGRTKNL